MRRREWGLVELARADRHCKKFFEFEDVEGSSSLFDALAAVADLALCEAPVAEAMLLLEVLLGGGASCPAVTTSKVVSAPPWCSKVSHHSCPAPPPPPACRRRVVAAGPPAKNRQHLREPRRSTPLPRRAHRLEATDRLIHGLSGSGHIQNVVGVLGDPQGVQGRRYRRNGRTPTARMITTALLVGTFLEFFYSSPHLERVQRAHLLERRASLDEQLADLVTRLCRLVPLSGVEPSYFELLTAGGAAVLRRARSVAWRW